jgi:hypothetical protein
MAKKEPKHVGGFHKFVLLYLIIVQLQIDINTNRFSNVCTYYAILRRVSAIHFGHLQGSYKFDRSLHHVWQIITNGCRNIYTYIIAYNKDTVMTVII